MKVRANGLTLEVDVQGPASAPALLLVMGLGMQLTAWPDALVADLVARGLRVVRFDNRDAGLSQGPEAAGVPSLWRAGLRQALGLKVTGAPYTLTDMAADTLAMLDALGIGPVHVCGASMGGMVAQHMAVAQPLRVQSLTLLMTTSGARHLPKPKPAVQLALLQRPRGTGEDAVVAHLQRIMRLIGSPAFEPDPKALRQRLHDSVRRAWRPDGTARQLMAILADGDRSPLLARIQAPTLVLHGEADPLVPVASAYDLVEKIPGALLDTVPGMGHDLPTTLLPRLALAMARQVERAGRG